MERRVENLHSNMDKLKLVAITFFNLPAVSFTFQYGQIKAKYCEGYKRIGCIFTFQYRQIKTRASSRKATVIVRFTFQYEQIKTHHPKSPRNHISVFTFQYGWIKTTFSEFNKIKSQYLHSNMDRLKRNNFTNHIYYCLIYIPIWTD